MYQVLVVGHGGFAKGVREAVELIVGEQKNLSHQNLDEKHDHEYLENHIDKFLEKNEHAIIFADFTGGAPHKIGAMAIHKGAKKTQFIVSGAPVSFLIETMLMLPDVEDKPADVKKALEGRLESSFKVAKVMSF